MIHRISGKVCVGMKGKIAWLGAVVGLCVMFLAGCGEAKLPDVIKTQTVFISKDGQITLWLVMEFDGENYKLSELTSMAMEEAAEFNEGRAVEKAVSVEKVETLADGSGKVAVTYQFGDWKSCTEFIGNELFYGTNELFYGTVSEAVSEGYGTRAILRNVKDNTLEYFSSMCTEEALKQTSGKYLIVTDVKANVYCPGKVEYISDGAVVNEDGSVNTFGVEGLAYILLK